MLIEKSCSNSPDRQTTHVAEAAGDTHHHHLLLSFVFCLHAPVSTHVDFVVYFYLDHGLMNRDI